MTRDRELQERVLRALEPPGVSSVKDLITIAP